MSFSYLSKGSETTRVITRDPQKSQTKGRKKDGDKTTQNIRFKTGLEESLNKSLVKRKVWS